MFEAFHYKVEKLDRIAYADITYDGLPRGRFRYLSKLEIRKLKKLAGLAEAVESSDF